MVDAKVYPQLARLDEQGDAISTVHDFFDWLDQQGLELCRVERGTGHDRYLPHIEDRDATIYRFVGIDPQAIERERRALLAAHTLREYPARLGQLSPNAGVDSDRAAFDTGPLRHVANNIEAGFGGSFTLTEVRIIRAAAEFIEGNAGVRVDRGQHSMDPQRAREIAAGSPVASHERGVKTPVGISREAWLKACGDYCAPDGTCSCAKFADDPAKCERRKEMEAAYGVDSTRPTLAHLDDEAERIADAYAKDDNVVNTEKAIKRLIRHALGVQPTLKLVGFADRQQLAELSFINGMSVWCDGPTMYHPEPGIDVDAPPHLVAIYTTDGVQEGLKR